MEDEIFGQLSQAFGMVFGNPVVQIGFTIIIGGCLLKILLKPKDYYVTPENTRAPGRSLNIPVDPSIKTEAEKKAAEQNLLDEKQAEVKKREAERTLARIAREKHENTMSLPRQVSTLMDEINHINTKLNSRTLSPRDAINRANYLDEELPQAVDNFLMIPKNLRTREHSILGVPEKVLIEHVTLIRDTLLKMYEDSFRVEHQALTASRDYLIDKTASN